MFPSSGQFFERKFVVLVRNHHRLRFSNGLGCTEKEGPVADKILRQKELLTRGEVAKPHQSQPMSFVSMMDNTNVYLVILQPAK